MISFTFHPKRKDKKEKVRKNIPVKWLVLGNLLGLSMTLLFLIFDLGVSRFSYRRSMELILPPLEYENFWRMPEYGEVSIIIGEKGDYYLHFREEYNLGTHNSKAERHIIETGLNSDCLHLFTKEELSLLLLYLLEIEEDYVLSFSFMPKTKYRDMIRFLDQINRHNTRKYIMTSLTKEEEIALTKFIAENH